jgi:sec-independent protein translocase protein TatB
MFNIGGGQLLVILLVALLVLGPDKLPEAARTAGKVLSQVRNVSAGFQQEMREAMDAVDIDMDSPVTGSDSRSSRSRQSTSSAPALPTGTTPPKAIEATSTPDAGTGGAASWADAPGPVSEGTTWRTDGPSSSFS